MISFRPDMTLRWACRAGEYMLWASCQGPLSGSSNPYGVADVWELRDGNFVTITNRNFDLPDWFDLHPLEVSGRLVEWMRRRLDAGYEPNDPMDGPNLWRIRAGDRVAWVGTPRGGVDGEGPVLGLLNFNADALVYGEPLEISRGFPTFGGFEQKDQSEERVRLAREDWKAICSLGEPRIVAADPQWRLG